MENEDPYEVQQDKFLNNFSELAGRIMESGDVCFREFNKRLTEIYRDMTD